MLIGLHPTYLSDVEQGYRNVSLLTMLRLAEGLGVSPTAMVDGLMLRRAGSTETSIAT